MSVKRRMLQCLPGIQGLNYNKRECYPREALLRFMFETTFKTRYNNHTHSFRDKKKQNGTELSKLHRNLTSAGKKPKISWSIEKHANAYQRVTNKCQLCLAEKVSILQANPSTTINRRSELVSKCRHKNNFKLKNFKPD